MTIQPEVLKTLRSQALAQVTQGKKRTLSFIVDFSEVDPSFVGKITVHYPSQLERMKIGVVQSQLLGGTLDVDVMTHNIAHITATLEVVMDSKPDWFDIENPDLEYYMLETVFTEYSNWVSSFRRPSATTEHEGDSQNGGSTVPVVGTEDVPSSTN